MNYASAVFVFFALISILWYFISGRKNFKGPPVPVDQDTEHVGRTIGDEFGRTTIQHDTPSSGSHEGKLFTPDK